MGVVWFLVGAFALALDAHEKSSDENNVVVAETNETQRKEEEDSDESKMSNKKGEGLSFGCVLLSQKKMPSDHFMI